MKFFKWLAPALVLVLVSCQKEVNTNYNISIESKKLYNGVRSYIKEMDEKGREVILDTSIAQNQKLDFIGVVDYPKVSFLSIDGIEGRLMLFLENEEMTIELDTINIAMSKVKGSGLNDELAAFNRSYADLRMSLQPHINAFRSARGNNNKAATDSIKAIMDSIGVKSLYYPLEYAKANPYSYLSVYIIDSQIGANANFDYEDYIAAFEVLDSSLKTTPVGLRIEKKLEKELEKFEKSKVTAVGAQAPDFSGPTPDGKELALSEVYGKGKYTIIDFWAAWCGPCRRENPNVVRIYEKYHEKGLEIIGVSLDGNRNQKDPKDAWLKAIESDKLNWNHVSNLQYFGPIARQYNVNSIPAMFIIDGKGKIVAKNLRGRALENKIEELLGS